MPGEPGPGWGRFAGKTLARYVILTLGTLVVGSGIILLPLPGPGILIVITGVVILSLESARARLALHRLTCHLRHRWPEAHRQMQKLRERLRNWRRFIHRG